MKRKLKKEVKIGIIVLTLILVVLITIRVINIRNSYEFKFKKIGYSKDEVAVILNLKKAEIETLLKSYNYNKNYTLFIKDKYFIFKNIDLYDEYYKQNSNLDVRNVVEIVNTKRNYNYYGPHVYNADVSKGIGILVNKYYKLNNDYKPDNLKDLSLQISYSGNKLASIASIKIEELIREAKKLNYNLIVNSSYRDYAYQESIYSKDEKVKGKDETDKLIARPGHSEHQLGLAVDIDIYKKKYDKLEDTDEYKWLIDNAHKYGFILRYPKDKVNITGYNFEPWHYRYVGNEISEYIYKNKITFDEYYAYYIEK